MALIQDRPVLGGNGSSEVRVWPEGHTRQKPFVHIGEIVEEILTLFADCTGDGTVGYLAGAEYEMSHEGNMGASNLWNVLDQADKNQLLACECKDKDALTTQTEKGQTVAPFPRLEWALDLSQKPFPGRSAFNGQWGNSPLGNLGGWFWESGFDKDPINDIERIRDLNMRAMYGAWDTLKNIDKQYPNHRLGWSAFIAGKRESRRLIGDVMLRADDFRSGTQFPDAAFPNTWHIGIHVPDPQFDKGLKGDEFISVCTTGSH